MLVHLDTDLGSDTDDACALALLLGTPGVEIVGITTTIDPRGIRAGFVQRCLELGDRQGIPVCAGAEVSMTTRLTPGGIPTHYWPTAVSPRPAPPGAALDLLASSIERGATVVAIGPFTNLGLLEILRPGTLGRADVTVMGGCVGTASPGLPQWGPDMDWNVQCDTLAASVVFDTARLTVTNLPVTLAAHLRACHLPRLRAAGPLGSLLADQAVAHGADNGMADLARRHPGLPDDLLNFQYDAVACAVAIGSPDVTVEEIRLRSSLQGDVLRLEADPAGRPARILTDLDAEAFTASWFEAIEALGRKDG